MNVVAIIQARISSTRLPGKIMLDLNGRPVLEHIVRRISAAKNVNQTIVATSTDSSDDQVEQFCGEKQIPVFRGSLDNVLERYERCAKRYGADIIVRCTADNALICAEIIDAAVDLFTFKNLDYLSYKKSLPLGMGVEVFTMRALERAFTEAHDPECLEHVTPYIWRNPDMFQIVFYADPMDEDHSNLRFTMDEPADYELIKRIYASFSTDLFLYQDILETLAVHPEWVDLNKDVKQNTVKYRGKGKRPDK